MTRTHSSAARRLTALLLSPLLAAGFLVAAAPATAAATGVTVQGTVTGETSPAVYEPESEVVVSLFPLVGSGDPIRVVRTGLDGTYGLYDVPPGRYRLRFKSHPLVGADLVSTWLGNTPHESQSQILEVPAEGITGVDAQLEIGSTLSGVITDTELYASSVALAFLHDDTTGQYERLAYRGGTDASGRYTIRGLPAGSYTLRFNDSYDLALTSTVYWEQAEYISASTTIEVAADQQLAGFDATVGPGGMHVSRMAGPDRFATSVQISQSGYPSGSEAVFIVSGLNFPDALGAGPAAARIGAPILLVTPGGIPDSVKAELARLDPATIYIVGGPVSVSAEVEGELQEYTPNVVRFSGADRFETSRLVADHFWGASENRTAYLATGMNFPDALSAAPAAANEDAPVILVDGALDAVDQATASLLQQLGIEKVVIAGGESTVSAGVKSSIDQLSFIDESYRRNGSDRFATSIITNGQSFRLADTAFLATGSSFPDALAGAALAGSVSAPVYLVQQNCIPSGVWTELRNLYARDLILLGGESTLSNSVFQLKQC